MTIGILVENYMPMMGFLAIMTNDTAKICVLVGRLNNICLKILNWIKQKYVIIKPFEEKP